MQMPSGTLNLLMDQIRSLIIKWVLIKILTSYLSFHFLDWFLAGGKEYLQVLVDYLTYFAIV